MITPTSSIPSMLSAMLISLLPSDFHETIRDDTGWDSVLYGSPEEAFCDAAMHDGEYDICDIFNTGNADEDTLDMIDEIFVPRLHLFDTRDLLQAYRERFDPTANHTLDMI